MWRVRKRISLLALIVLFSCDGNGPSGPFESLEGLYSCQESSVHSGVKKYFVEIDQVKDANDLYILSNFHSQGENEFIYARLSGGSLQIENQVIRDLTVNGEGLVSDEFNEIQVYHTTDDGITQLDFTANLTR